MIAAIRELLRNPAKPLRSLAQFLLCAMLLLVIGCPARDPQSNYREVYPAAFEIEGKPLPDFSVARLGSDNPFTNKDIDRVTVLMFFGTFCGYCSEQMPVLNELREAYGDRVAVFAVNAREYANLAMDDRSQRVKAYMDDNKWADIPTLIAPTEAQHALGLAAVPTMMVIDSTRTVKYVGLAHHDLRQLKKLIDGAL